MAEPVVAQKAPYSAAVEAGKTYWWCACGQSSKQPFCDGSHKGSDFAPKPYTADKDGTAWFCGCKNYAEFAALRRISQPALTR